MRPRLEAQGYTYFIDSISAAQGFFAKKVQGGMYLTFGLTIDRYYDAQFTGNFYLSPTLKFAACWGDIPHESYIRPGELFSLEELSELIGKEAKYYDLWWDPFDEVEVEMFLKLVRLAEERLLADVELIEKIKASKDVRTLKERSEMVKSLYDSGFEYENKIIVLEKEKDKIPMRWFALAEYVLLSRNEKVNKYSVPSLAADAYRQYVLDHEQRS